MATKIPYVDEVWNPVIGCSKCSPGCANCYAERMAARLWHMEKEDGGYYKDLGAVHGWTGKTICIESALDKPLHWKKPRRILTCSMGDLFHESVPFEFIDKVLAMAGKTGLHTYQILTKRPKRMLEYYTHPETPKRLYGAFLKRHYTSSRGYPDGFWTGPAAVENEWQLPMSNIHLGVSICTPDELWKATELARIWAAYRWISFEPLLADIGDISSYLTSCREDDTDLDESGQHIDYIVIGCESLPGKAGRFQDGYENAARSLIQQCKAAGVPVYHKQMPINGKVVHDPSKFPADMRQQELINGK